MLTCARAAQMAQASMQNTWPGAKPSPVHARADQHVLEAPSKASYADLQGRTRAERTREAVVKEQDTDTTAAGTHTDRRPARTLFAKSHVARCGWTWARVYENGMRLRTPTRACIRTRWAS
eukprot:6183103-Pleurochrysis_carterae.AAC.2